MAAVLTGTGLSKLQELSKLQFDLLIRNINLQVKVMCWENLLAIRIPFIKMVMCINSLANTAYLFSPVLVWAKRPSTRRRSGDCHPQWEPTAASVGRMSMLHFYMEGGYKAQAPLTFYFSTHVVFFFQNCLTQLHFAEVLEGMCRSWCIATHSKHLNGCWTNK